MDTSENLIVANGIIKTADIESCEYNSITKKWDIKYKNGRVYSYNYNNISWLKNPDNLDPTIYCISHSGREMNHIKEIYNFKDNMNNYWHIRFENGDERDYEQNNLEIKKSCLANQAPKEVFSYLKEISKLSDIKDPESNEGLLYKRYNTIGFINDEIVLSRYLGSQGLNNIHDAGFIPIFPFGCNNSQYMAVERAMKNQLSVIQGPPGTGKTQTILNIIANILMQGKTVQVVSNNNAAIDNVYEKLSSEKNMLNFVVASLGKSENKKNFVETQMEEYPDLSSWRLNEGSNVSLERIKEKSLTLKKTFDYQEREARLKQELYEINLEYKYFTNYLKEGKINDYSIPLKKGVKSSALIKLLLIFQDYADKNKKLSLWIKIQNFFKLGIKSWAFYYQDFPKIIAFIRKQYYLQKKEEICNELSAILMKLSSFNNKLSEEMCQESMKLLKDKLAIKYQGKKLRQRFKEDDLRKIPQRVLDEYPVVLSTTFSSKSSLGNKVIYDYLIMDEASQVDIATGALALSCAHNAVIVGDTKQLPNIVTPPIEKKVDFVWNLFHVAPGYRFTNSFLQSILDVVPDVPKTLLHEHYRCHPKIINFCNQKFYNGELLIMTKDAGEKDVLKVVKTISGNHARGRYSQRQVDVVKEEIIPQLVQDKKNTGIIAPYKDQVEAMEKEFLDIDIATVHKFQGREKDTIIISTVDDKISDFVDDPYLLNVAVSRAKKNLIMVISGNKQSSERNISDLVAYIKRNNFDIIESSIYSVFDYLYMQYAVARKEYLKSHKRISEYNSENLMYALISDVLKEENYTSLGVVCHFPMNLLIRDTGGLNDEEYKYVINQSTHLDFLIYNRISKFPILAIEADGYRFHKKGTAQFERDKMKNRILKSYGIPLLRLPTNGSGEKIKIVNELAKIMVCN